MPTEEQIRIALIAVLKQVQDASGQVCPELSDDSRPLDSLPGFDSLLCVESTVALEASLGVQFKSDNLFIGVSGKTLTLKEAVQGALFDLQGAVPR